MSNETVITASDTTKAGVVVEENSSQVLADKLFDSNAKDGANGVVEKVLDEANKASDENSEAKAADDVKVETPKVPEKYELKLSEGSSLDSVAVERISSFAKEKGLSQEAAQELLSLEEQTITSFRDSQMKQHMETRKQWVESIKNDKEYGADKLNENVEIAKRIVNEFADEEFKQALDVTGYGDNPALFKFCVKIGKKLGIMGDTHVRGGSPTTPKKELHDILYPSHNKG